MIDLGFGRCLCIVASILCNCYSSLIIRPSSYEIPKDTNTHSRRTPYYSIQGSKLVQKRSTFSAQRSALLGCPRRYWISCLFNHIPILVPCCCSVSSYVPGPALTSELPPPRPPTLLIANPTPPRPGFPPILRSLLCVPNAIVVPNLVPPTYNFRLWVTRMKAVE